MKFGVGDYMYSVSSSFLPALRYSHTVVSQVDLYSPEGVPLVYDLPVSEGSVTVDGSSQVHRTCSVTVADPKYYKLVTPYGNQLFIRRGIKYISGAIEWVPLGYFRIDSVHESWPFNGLSISGADRAKVLVDVPFTHDDQVSDTRTVLEEIARIAADGFRLYGENYYGSFNPAISDLAPSIALLHQPYTPTDKFPDLYWVLGDSRVDAINNLALSAGVEFYFNPQGGPTVRKIPTINDPVVWTISSGNPDGILLTADRELTREETYNVVIVNSSDQSSIDPLIFTAEDLDPTSPTYVGIIGRSIYVYPTIVDSDRAQTVANSLLAQTRQLIRQISVTTVSNPALESGDVVQLNLPDGTTHTVLVDGFTIPLGSESSMDLNCRSSAPILTDI
jgi:Domain of unknown function (DUF5047)